MVAMTRFGVVSMTATASSLNSPTYTFGPAADEAPGPPNATINARLTTPAVSRLIVILLGDRAAFRHIRHKR
jgi:hypothetical protein